MTNLEVKATARSIRQEALASSLDAFEILDEIDFFLNLEEYEDIYAELMNQRHEN